MSGGPSAELTRNHGYWDIFATFLANCCNEKMPSTKVAVFFFHKKMAVCLLDDSNPKKPEDRTRCFG